MKEDITQNFERTYIPTSALLFYGGDEGTYVEHFDIDHNGRPINAHPLTVGEAERLATSLRVADRYATLTTGIMGANILSVDALACRVAWYTKASPRQLYFAHGLDIPSGTANVPALLWVADRRELRIYALANDRRPTERSVLYCAPFFNIYHDGRVCMGTVSINIPTGASLSDFTDTWERYFFQSYFSHLMGGYNPVIGNCAGIWSALIGSREKFPRKALRRCAMDIKKLLP